MIPISIWGFLAFCATMAALNIRQILYYKYKVYYVVCKCDKVEPFYFDNYADAEWHALHKCMGGGCRYRYVDQGPVYLCLEYLDSAGESLGCLTVCSLSRKGT